jgi:hypothetical protein
MSSGAAGGALQAAYTAALFKLQTGVHGLADLDRAIAAAEATIAATTDIREVEAEGEERRCGRLLAVVVGRGVGEGCVSEGVGATGAAAPTAA